MQKLSTTPLRYNAFTDNLDQKYSQVASSSGHHNIAVDLDFDLYLQRSQQDIQVSDSLIPWPPRAIAGDHHELYHYGGGPLVFPYDPVQLGGGKHLDQMHLRESAPVQENLSETICPTADNGKPQTVQLQAPLIPIHQGS